MFPDLRKWETGTSTTEIAASLHPVFKIRVPQAYFPSLPFAQACLHTTPPSRSFASCAALTTHSFTKSSSLFPRRVVLQIFKTLLVLEGVSSWYCLHLHQRGYSLALKFVYCPNGLITIQVRSSGSHLNTLVTQLLLQQVVSPASRCALLRITTTSLLSITTASHLLFITTAVVAADAPLPGVQHHRTSAAQHLPLPLKQTSDHLCHHVIMSSCHHVIMSSCHLSSASSLTPTRCPSFPPAAITIQNGAPRGLSRSGTLACG